MSSTRPLRRTAALAAVAVVALSACGDNADDSDSGSDGGSSGGGSSASGEQPDLNGDGDVKIGVLSPGETWTQDSPGLGGTAEAFDFFGIALE